MKAIWLEKVGGGLALCERPAPTPCRGGVVVDVMAIRVPSYTRAVVDGRLRYDIPTPLIPGPACIGRIAAVGDDVFDLQPGQYALCNSLLSSGDMMDSTDDILIGWTGNSSPRGHRMQAVWRHGSFAEQALYPAGCLVPMPEAEAMDLARLPFFASLAIADGAIHRGGLSGGQTVIVNGATGQLGSAAVMVALARGAATVVAAGRNLARLDDLKRLSARVRPVQLSGQLADDARALMRAGDGSVDLVLDLLASTPTPEPTLAAIDALRPGGTAVLVGGVQHELPLAYSRIMRSGITVRGSFMFPREVARSTWQLVRSGALDLGPVRTRRFGLNEIETVLDVAAELGGLDIAVLLPNS